MPLAMAAPGDRVRMLRVRGGQRVRRRLADLGLGPGTELRVIQANAFGPVIVGFKGDARLALGRGVAHRIEVEPVA